MQESFASARHKVYANLDFKHMKHIAAVVVTYNRKDLLMLCIDRLLQQDLTKIKQLYPDTTYDLDILIVDNASTDRTQEQLQPLAASSLITYYNTGSNLGGAGGFNFGMRKAVEAGYDYVWVMDDDCLAHPDALEELLLADHKLQEDYGFLSSKALWKDGSICTFNVQRHPLTKSITDFDKEIQPATLASFVSLFVPSKVILELGLPIKDFFIWSDDWEFTRRISKQFSCYVVGTSVVDHYSQNNGKGNVALDSPERIERYLLAYRNDVYWYKKEGIKGYSYLLSRALYHTLLVLLRSDSKKGLRLKTILRGNIEGFSFNPDIEYVKPLNKSLDKPSS